MWQIFISCLRTLMLWQGFEPSTLWSTSSWPINKTSAPRPRTDVIVQSHRMLDTTWLLPEDINAMEGVWTQYLKIHVTFQQDLNMHHVQIWLYKVTGCWIRRDLMNRYCLQAMGIRTDTLGMQWGDKVIEYDPGGVSLSTYMHDLGF